MITAMRLSESAIKGIATVKFFQHFMDKAGNVAWETFKDDLDKVI